MVIAPIFIGMGFRLYEEEDIHSPIEVRMACYRLMIKTITTNIIYRMKICSFGMSAM